MRLNLNDLPEIDAANWVVILQKIVQKLHHAIHAK